MLCSSTWNGSVSRSCLEVFTGDADLCSLREDDFSDCRRLDSMAPWRCGRGGALSYFWNVVSACGEVWILGACFGLNDSCFWDRLIWNRVLNEFPRWFRSAWKVEGHLSPSRHFALVEALCCCVHWVPRLHAGAFILPACAGWSSVSLTCKLE